MVKRSDYVQINSNPDEEEEGEDGEEESPFPTQTDSTTTTTNNNNNNKNGIASSTPSKLSKNPSATALHVDELFNKWTRTIAEKVHLKNNNKNNKSRNRNNLSLNGKKRVIEDRDRDSKVEIMASVFEVWVKKEDKDFKGKGKEISENEMMMTLDHLDPMTRETFDLLVARVEDAIEQGTQPRLNSKGSSGSYFARDPSGSTIGIFKPKDEEPYGRLNPKLTKWIHRNFLSKIIPFGRACLIPQLSYLSESAASLMDRRLQANIVPRTEVVDLASSAFYYDWIDRERAKSGRKLPAKPGSFQVFLKGYTDATEFLRTHPYPGRPLAQTLDPSAHRRHRINILAPCSFLCGKADAEGEDDEEEGGWNWGGEDDGTAASRERRKEKEEAFKWSDETMMSFREELEKLVVFDYIIRNTDRGLDNFMIKGCMCPRSSSVSSDVPVIDQPGTNSMSTNSAFTSRSSSVSTTASESKPHMHIAAIDNSLAFPHSHPVGWRSYSYGWLHLPVSLIGAPFTMKTREHYLPMLTNPVWWAETTLELRREFAKDPDFKESMFRKQMAVMKGQAWNLVQSLKDDSDGPLELCRRGKKLVWDDLIEVSDDHVTQSLINATSNPLPLHPSSTANGTQSPRVTQDATPSSPPFSPITSTILEPPLSPLLATHPPRTDFSSAHNSTSPHLNRSSSDRNRPAGGRRISVLSLSASSKIPQDEFESITGAEMMKRLDKVEAAADKRYLGGRNKIGEEDDDEDDDDNFDWEGEGEENTWGVRSENDVRRSSASATTTKTNSLHGRKDSYSFDIDRSGLITKPRNRSGSLSSILGVGLGNGRISNSRKSSYGSNGGINHSKYSSAEESSRLHGTRESDVEGDSKKVVVIERMESVDEMPVFSWF